jgi:Holliday junction resolvase
MWKSTKAKSWTTTRIETWATPGVPDVDICDERGLFHKVELKVADGNKVELRPHQVAYLTRHQHASVWILVKKGVDTQRRLRIIPVSRATSGRCADGRAENPARSASAVL